MSWLLNGLYLLALVLLFPWLIYRAWQTGRYRQGLGAKLLGLASPLPRLPRGSRPAWFHGVSVGEIHLLRQVVTAFRKRYPDQLCVISTTTDTGKAEAEKWFPDLPVFFFPFDFSWAVSRTLRKVNPALVVLAEGELWPNFLMNARRLRVPVVMINGRMSPRSYARYRGFGPLPRWLLGHLDLLLVQTEAYAACLRALGAPPERVHVTGNVKYDGVNSDRDNPRTREFRRLLNIARDDLIWIAGSTFAPEEELVLKLFQTLRPVNPRLRLVVVPRHPDRFNEVATLLERSGLPFVRRSRLSDVLADRTAVVLGDTLGELSYLWGLADLAYVGGSLDGKRGGQNMLEPAAYGAAVLFGPHVWNFREAARQLVEVGGALQVGNAVELEQEIRRLAGSSSARALLGQSARSFILTQQGATERTLELLTPLLRQPERQRLAA
jgi:3-deoxy-D-manno-octulosonic-acid transferase